MTLDAGYRRLLDLRRERVEAGERPLGWKVGFGSPAAMERLGIQAPLVGFLTDRTLVESGAEVSLAGWTAPLLEPEVAVYLDADGGIAAYGAAIELADLHTPGEPVEAILAGNVYHRTVILGRERANRIDGLRARVLRDGEPIGETDDVLELTGDPEALVRLVRETAGDAVRAGDVVITGSVVPPIAVAPGQTVRYDLLPLGSLTVTLG